MANHKETIKDLIQEFMDNENTNIDNKRKVYKDSEDYTNQWPVWSDEYETSIWEKDKETYTFNAKHIKDLKTDGILTDYILLSFHERNIPLAMRLRDLYDILRARERAAWMFLMRRPDYYEMADDEAEKQVSYITQTSTIRKKRVTDLVSVNLKVSQEKVSDS